MKYLQMNGTAPYEAPQMTLLLVRFEGQLLQGSPYNDDGNEEFVIEEDDNW